MTAIAQSPENVLGVDRTGRKHWLRRWFGGKTLPIGAGTRLRAKPYGLREPVSPIQKDWNAEWEKMTPAVREGWLTNYRVAAAWLGTSAAWGLLELLMQHVLTKGRRPLDDRPIWTGAMSRRALAADVLQLGKGRVGHLVGTGAGALGRVNPDVLGFDRVLRLHVLKHNLDDLFGKADNDIKTNPENYLGVDKTGRIHWRNRGEQLGLDFSKKRGPVSAAPTQPLVQPTPAKPARPVEAKTYEADPKAQMWEVLEPEFLAEQARRRQRSAEREVAFREKAMATTKHEHWRQEHQKALEYWREQATAPLSDYRAEKLRAEYIKLVRKAISQGKPVPLEVVRQRPEFTKAVDARARYEKGRHTSFANESVAVVRTMQGERGYKVKRQDGKPIPQAQIDELARGVTEVEEVWGPLKELLRRSDLTLVHTNGKHPFLTGYGGTYHPVDRSINTGVRSKFSGKNLPSLAHEMAHWLDYEAGGVLGHKGQVYASAYRKGRPTASVAVADDRAGSVLIRQATAKIQNSYLVRSLAKRKAGPGYEELQERFAVSLGPYWRAPDEVFARLVEQYVATVRGNKPGAWSHSADYANTAGYWSAEDFAELMPMVAAELGRRIEILGGTASHLIGHHLDVEEAARAAGFGSLEEARDAIRRDMAGNYDANQRRVMGLETYVGGMRDRIANMVVPEQIELKPGETVEVDFGSMIDGRRMKLVRVGWKPVVVESVEGDTLQYRNPDGIGGGMVKIEPEKVRRPGGPPPPGAGPGVWGGRAGGPVRVSADDYERQKATLEAREKELAEVRLKVVDRDRRVEGLAPEVRAAILNRGAETVSAVVQADEK